MNKKKFKYMHLQKKLSIKVTLVFQRFNSKKSEIFKFSLYTGNKILYKQIKNYSLN